MSTSTQSFQFAGISATSAPFYCDGGNRALTVSATFGGGNIQLQILSFDKVTWINVGSPITANGFVSQALPPGVPTGDPHRDRGLCGADQRADLTILCLSDLRPGLAVFHPSMFGLRCVRLWRVCGPCPCDPSPSH
jgi:hypothetical protein